MDCGPDWGRADAMALARMSVLHSVLFDVMAKSRPVCSIISAPLRVRIARELIHSAQRRPVLLAGHDDNIAGLASWLGGGLEVPVYAANDPPIGGGLEFEVWRATVRGGTAIAPLRGRT